MENHRFRDRLFRRVTKTALWGSVSAIIIIHFLHSGLLRKKNIDDSVFSK